ncbi:MAG TPA: hypothetical protein IAC19_11005 [Candidatus Ventricola gallistercoris]|nr:hypothetical protein [Candidatus Ventricola gallistercoris]
MPDELKFEIINEIGVVAEHKAGWRIELNRISWNGNEPKYDLRNWGPERSKMGKGITLTEQEIRNLHKILSTEVDFLDEMEG